MHAPSVVARRTVDRLAGRGTNTGPPNESLPELPADVHAALAHGRKIEAIKRLRKLKNVDLKTAKQEVDGYLRAHPELARRVNTSGEGLSGLVVFALIAMLLMTVLYSLFK